MAFVRFPDIIGNQAWQIPPGSTIESATLQLTRFNSSTWPAHVRLVSDDWDENTISGTAYPGTSVHIGSIAASGVGPQVLNVTAAVQVWAAGTANYGLRIVDGDLEDDNYQQFWSDDAPDLANRPLLTVTFTPQPITATESTTWGKVKALYQ